MPIGVIINALSVAAGGVIGALFGHKLPEKFNSELTKIFGVCSMGMGVSSIGLMKNMPAVIFAVIIGTAIGLAVNLGGMINNGATCMEKPVGKLFPNKNKSMSREEYMSMLVTNHRIVLCQWDRNLRFTGFRNEWRSYNFDFEVDSGFLYCNDFWRNIRYGDCSSCDSAVRDFSDHICSSKTYLSTDHAGYDCRLQGMWRLSASCNWFPDRKDSRFSSRRHDPGHGACDAGELVSG